MAEQNALLREWIFASAELGGVKAHALAAAVVGLLWVGCAPRASVAEAPSASPAGSRVAACAKPPATWPPADSSLVGNARDRRTSREVPRPRAVLINELQGLDRLQRLGNLDPSNEAQLLRRMAETCVELGASTQHDMARGADHELASKLLRAAHNKAIEYYGRLLAEHPDYAKRDEVLYYLGYERELLGDYDTALSLNLQLLRELPESPFVPIALLGVAELCFRAATTQSKRDAAVVAYQEVLRYPPPTNIYFHYASYKLAYLNLMEGDLRGARKLLATILEQPEQASDRPDRGRLVSAARSLAIQIDASLSSRCPER